MYAVIFKARIKHFDDDYTRTATRMRELAKRKYGCVDFVSSAEDGLEIAISYWNSEADIQAWNLDPEHKVAQQKGREHWYSEYRIEVVQLIRHYQHTC